MPQVISRLEQAIVAGRYPANSYLPGESNLALDFGVSRPTLRRALATLEQRGLIRRQAGRGNLILDPDQGMADDRIRVIGTDINPSGMTASYYRRMLAGLEAGVGPIPIRLWLLHPADIMAGTVEDCDALVVMGLGDDAVPALGRLADSGRPVVCFNRPFDDRRLATVGVDYAAEAERATRSLTDQGYRQVAYLGSGSNAKGRRLAGCRAAVAAVGGSLTLLPSGESYPSLVAMITELVAQTPEIAFFAEDATHLQRLLSILCQQEHRPPVLCFDEASAYSEEFAYPVVQILMPLEEIGRRGGIWLRERLSGRSIPPLRTILQADIGVQSAP